MRPRAALLLAVPALLACAAAAVAASWELPATTLSAAGEQGREPAVVADGSGVVTAVWSPLVGVAGPVRASRFANGEWSAAASLSNPGTSANTAALVADSAGVITAVWSVQRGDDYVIQAARYAQGSWGAAQDISAAGGNARYPTAAVDSSGVVTVVWERVVGSTSVIQAARYANGAWSSTADIATASTTAGTYAVPDVAVDGAGVVTAVWVASSVGQSTVTAARYTGGIWSAPQALSSGGPPDIARQPQVAANASGSVIAVWQQFVTPNYKVATSRFTGGAWSAASVIAGSASAVTEFPQVVVDASGVATTIWQQGLLGATVIRSSRDSGVGWGPPVDVSDATLAANTPVVAVDPSGSLMVAWEQWGAGLTIDEAVPAAARYTGAAWGVPQVLGTSPASRNNPAVALDAKGSATVAWAGHVGAIAQPTRAAQFFTVPSPPRTVTATPGDGSAVLTWTAPANDAGSPITGYQVTVSPGGLTCAPTPPTTRCAFTGLSNGTAYSFSITAANALGTSWASTATTTPRVPESGGSGAGGGGATAPLTATIAASRRTVASGKRITASIRVRNTGKATATKVVACIKAPKGLSIVQKPRPKKRLRNPACFTVKTLTVGKQVTRKVTLQASATRKVTRSVTGTARAKGIAKVKAKPRKVVITVARS